MKITCIIFFSCVLVCVHPIRKLSNRDRKLLKFKKEVDKIGVDLENFAFDVAQEVVKKSDLYIDPEYDYDNDYTEDSTTAKATKEDYENTAGTDTKYLKSNEIAKEKKYSDVSMAKNTKNENTSTVIQTSKNRTKRSPDAAEFLEGKNILDNPVLDNSVGESLVPDNKQCYQKPKEEQHLERQHIEDLKEEIKHLYALVSILRDQHKILSELDKERESDMTQRFDPKELLRVLEHLNNNDLVDKGVENDDGSYSTHKELAKIKSDLRRAVAALDKTKNVLVKDRKKEMALENELERQKIELNLLKETIEKMYQNGTTKAENETVIVGSPLHLPKAFPVLKPEAKGAQQLVNKRTIQKENTRESRDEGRSQARASDLEELSRLLNGIDKPKKTDLESKLADLEEELEKNAREEKTREQLQLLQKLISQAKQPAQTSKTDHDRDVAKRLKLLVQLMNKPQGKTDDGVDVDDELRQLQSAIEKLRPKEETSGFGVESLRDIFGDGRGQSGGSKTVKLTRQQLLDLRQRLDQMISSGAVNSAPAAVNVDTTNLPPPYPLWYGNHRNFGPYNFPYAYDQSQYGPEPTYPNPYQQHAGLDGPRDYPSATYPYAGDFWRNRYAKNRFFPAALYSPEDPGRGDPGQAGSHLQEHYQAKDIEELKVQIDALQNVIDGLNYSNYGNGPEDQATVANLERQIYDLRGIVNSLNQEVAPLPPPSYNQHPTSYNQHPPSYNQPPPSYNPLPPNHDPTTSPPQQPYENHQVIKRAAVPEKSPTQVTDSQLLDDVYSKLKAYIFEDNRSSQRSRSSQDELEHKISNLKAQLDNQYQTHNQPPSARTPYEQFGLYYPSNNQYKKNEPNSLFHQKADELFGSIVVKIIEKVIASLPTIFGKLFSSAFYGLTNFDDQYSGNYELTGGYSQNSVQNILKSFGVIGYIPLILLKLIDGLDTFVRALKKNSFFKNFLLPALVVLVVSGSVIFLIWWLQGDGDNSYKQIGYENPQDQAGYRYPNQYSRSVNSYHTRNYGYRDPRLMPGYSRSYYDTSYRNK